MAEARFRFGAIVRNLVRSFLLDRAGRLEAMVGGPFDLVLLVPSSHRPGTAPLGLVADLSCDVTAALPTARWAPDLLRRADAAGWSPPVAHMRPDPAAFRPTARERRTVAGMRALLIDDTYVSGARSQSAAAALQLAGARSALIVPIGRVLRPDRVASHADFLRRHAT